MLAVDERLRHFDRYLAKVLESSAHPETPAARLARRRAEGLLVGYANDHPVRMPFEALYSHGLVAGKSGRGKSKFLQSVATQMMLAGYTVVVLDAKGDLCSDLLKVAITMRKRVDQVAVIDPSEREQIVGLNYLEVFPGGTPESHGKTVLEGLKKIYREADTTKIWLEEYGIAALTPLAAAGLTLAELYDFVSTTDPEFRHAVLKQSLPGLSDSIYQSRWSELSALKASEQALMTSAIRSRGSLLRLSAGLKPMLGQTKTTVPWERMLNTPGNLILANLGRSSNFTEDESRMLGITILHQISAWMWARMERPDDPRERVFVLVDEAERFVDRSLADGYEKLRGLGASFLCSFQHLDQLRREDEYTASAIIGDSNVFITFATQRSDAEVLAREMYSGHLDMMRIKNEIYQTKHRPVESTRTVVTRSHASSASWGESSNSGYSSGTGFADGTMTPDDWRREDQGSSSRNNSRTSGESYGSSASNGGSMSDSVSTTETPFVEQHEYRELSNRTYVSFEEQWEEAVGLIKGQGVQRAIVSAGDYAPVAVTTPTVKELGVSTPTIQTFVAAVLRRDGRPRDDVLCEIANRPKALLLTGRSKRPAVVVALDAGRAPGAPPPEPSPPTPPTAAASNTRAFAMPIAFTPTARRPRRDG